ncbi:hypothetical protein HZ326_15630 [Fusarium oxysporum f. sp. albedinis]|nr:hypothetical protein HZ326_15630 [Fusarium oxysporum f. sp. albedinis]
MRHQLIKTCLAFSEWNPSGSADDADSRQLRNRPRCSYGICCRYVLTTVIDIIPPWPYFHTLHSRSRGFNLRTKFTLPLAPSS